MEIELSWPAWLQKVSLFLFRIFVIVSFTHQIFVASTNASHSHYTKNSTKLLTSDTGVRIGHHPKNSPWKPLMKFEKEIANKSVIVNQNGTSEEKRNNTQNHLMETSQDQPQESVNEPPMANIKLSYTAEGNSGSETVDIRMHDLDSLIFNETFWEILECDDFLEMEPPPSFIKWIPPPPIPPFLSDKEILLDLNEEELPHKNKITFDNQFCTLCSWAKTGANFTQILESPKKNASKRGNDKAMIGTLVGVAVISAALGATLMAVLFKCKKSRTSTNERGSGCAMVINWRRWISTATHKIHPQGSTSRNKSNPENAAPNAADITEGENIERPQRTIALRLWRGCDNVANQPPTIQTSSPDSENSYYSEEHYVSGDTGSSVVNAELGSSCNSHQNSDPQIDPHHYSEIEDICYLASLRQARELRDQDTYENFNFNLPDISSNLVQNDGSIYSATPSAPSSAYYSDISSGELYAIQRNHRNKRKRKRNLRSNSERNYPFVVSNKTQTNPASESRVASIQPIHLTHHQHNCIPETFQHNCIPETLQIINNTNHLVDCSNYLSQNMEGINFRKSSPPQNCLSYMNNLKKDPRSCGDLQGINLYELNRNPCDEDNCTRQSQVPYRHLSYPNCKRHLRAFIQAQNVASVPSEYI